jgi:hypothetical protein
MGSKPTGRQQKQIYRRSSLRPPASHASDRASQLVSRSQKIVFSLAKSTALHALLFLAAVWVALLMTARFAVMDIVQLPAAQPSESLSSTSKPQDAKPETSLNPSLPSSALSPKPPSTSSTHHLPLLSLSVVALTCAAGCLALSQVMKLRQPAMRRSSSSVIGSQRSIASAQTPALPVVDPALESAAIPVSVVLLPESQSHPLDWEEPSLADNLDLRQQRPLSYWLAEPDEQAIEEDLFT